MSGTPEAPTSFHSNANPLDRVDSAKYLSEQLESPISELAERAPETRLDHASLHTTLGIELEFVLAHVTTFPQVHRESSLGGLLGVRAVRHMLQQPVTVRCATCNKRHKTKLTVILDEDCDEDYTGWIVTEDGSIRTKEETTRLKDKQGHVRFHKIEVVSRVLSAETNRDTRQSRDQPEHTHSITFGEEISAVLGIINGMSGSTIKNVPGRFYPFVNSSCGLHVHVGNQQVGFPLQTVKNFLTVFALCERQIDMLNSAQRIGGSDLPTRPVQDRFLYDRPASGCAAFGLWDDSVYNIPLSAWHHIGVHHRIHCLQAGHEKLDPLAAYGLYLEGKFGNRETYSLKDVDLLDQDVDLLDQVRTGRYPENMFAESAVLEKAAHQYSAGANVVVIQNAPTVLALNSLMATGHESTINLANLCIFPWEGVSPDKKMTIELRHHAGTLDVQQVLSWVDFVISAIRHSHDKQSYEQMADTRFSDPDYDAIDLLAELGCNEHTVQHYAAQLHENNGGELYADSKKAAASKIVSELSTTEEGKIIAPVLTRSIEQQTTAFHPDHVSRRICEKLLVGAYGHFSDEHLDKLFSRIIPKPADEAKERLRLGQGLRGALPEDSVDMVQNEQLDCRRTQMQTHQDNTNPRTHVLDNEQNDPVQEQHPTKTSASGRPNTASSKDSVASFLETRSRNNSAKTSSTEDHTVDDSDEDPSAQILESAKQILPSPGKEYPEKVTRDWAELELTMQESVRRNSETSVLTFEF
ncbi:hypothetical protein KC331_g1329 [Hortaea werneckii]|nr:hypothetical protein KC331_g1329 [Hortaea werneckii]KAI7722205.1 hypothetical protein KC353_g704 [Hortaea werneckii]